MNIAISRKPEPGENIIVFLGSDIYYKTATGKNENNKVEFFLQGKEGPVSTSNHWKINPCTREGGCLKNIFQNSNQVCKCDNENWNEEKEKGVIMNRIDIKEFKDEGFLQEANRQFFHPLGLALEINIDWPNTIKRLEEIDEKIADAEKEKFDNNPSNHPHAVYSLGGIWDYRDDPDGMFFGKGVIDKEKIKKVNSLRKLKTEQRKNSGFKVSKYGTQQIEDSENVPDEIKETDGTDEQ